LAWLPKLAMKAALGQLFFKLPGLPGSFLQVFLWYNNSIAAIIKWLKITNHKNATLKRGFHEENNRKS
jgi:hypothetical protein